MEQAMRPQLQVIVSKPSNIPCAKVPADAMWDLVEYLSWQRVQAVYNFATPSFTVSFPHLDVETAQRLLDGWRIAAERAEPASRHDDTPEHLRAYAVSH
jgi:hypothetical protein